MRPATGWRHHHERRSRRGGHRDVATAESSCNRLPGRPAASASYGHLGADKVHRRNPRSLAGVEAVLRGRKTSRSKEPLGLEPAKRLLTLPDVDDAPTILGRAGDVGEQTGWPIRTQMLLHLPV